MRIYSMLVLLVTMGFSTAWAAEKLTEEIPGAVLKGLIGVIGDVNKASVRPAPIAGLYEAAMGEDIFYITADGRYLVMGNIFDLKTRSNLTSKRRDELQQARNPERKEKIDALNEKDMIVFAPEGKTKYTINVFTDVDCGYCAKIHREVPKLNEAGVKVRYLAFPRAGVGSKTYNKMVSVWCAEDQQKAMTDAKTRRKVKEAKCNNPVERQYKLGQELGVTGTPALVLSNGELVPGYLPADRLIARLEKMQKKQEK
jgi:thiol:disulfide interchange protein DsbC